METPKAEAYRNHPRSMVEYPLDGVNWVQFALLQAFSRCPRQ